VADRHIDFPGTYFNKTTVLRFAQALKIMAWVVVAIYGLQLILSLGTTTYQLLQGMWFGMSIPDIIQNYLSTIGTPLHGIVYSFALFGISQLLLIFLDIEDNTRRVARGGKD
jgi:hypothetical protein